MVVYRDILTPRFAHLIFSVVDDEVNFVTVMCYWLLWKCLLVPETELKQEDRVKSVVLSAIEMFAALSFTYGNYYSIWPWIYCSCVFGLTAVRSIYREQLDLVITLSAGLYWSMNLIVHLVDFLVLQQIHGHINDEQLFLRMFSYKLFQALLVLQLAIIYSQSLQPTIKSIQDSPIILLRLFELTVPVNALMFVSFLFELTFYD